MNIDGSISVAYRSILNPLPGNVGLCINFDKFRQGYR